MAASQRSAAADVGHGAGAGCCAVAGAALGFLELSKAVRCRGLSNQAIKCKKNTCQIKDGNVLVLMIDSDPNIHRVWYSHISGGGGCSSHPCPKELPPWFLERRNISRRHPGRGRSGKLVCLVSTFCFLVT